MTQSKLENAEENHISPSQTNVPFYTPENVKCDVKYHVFRGYRNETLVKLTQT